VRGYDQLTEAGIRLVRWTGYSWRHLKDCFRRRKNPHLQDSAFFGENGCVALKGDLCVGGELPTELVLLCLRQPSHFVLNENARLRGQPDATTHCTGIVGVRRPEIENDRL